MSLWRLASPKSAGPLGDLRGELMLQLSLKVISRQNYFFLWGDQSSLLGLSTAWMRPPHISEDNLLYGFKC